MTEKRGEFTTITVAPDIDFSMPGYDVVGLTMDSNGNAVVLMRRIHREAWEGGDADEARDEGVTVGPGDEVLLDEDATARGTVIGECGGEIVVGWDCGDIMSDYPDALRTPDGRPVSGFRDSVTFTNQRLERDKAILRERIAELEREVEDYRVRLLDEEGRTADAERELDEQCRLLGMGSEREAKLMAERDELERELEYERALRKDSNNLVRDIRQQLKTPKSLSIVDHAAAVIRERNEARAERAKPCGWVWLDDDTIERVVARVANGAAFIAVLRDLRDGKLGGGNA